MASAEDELISHFCAITGASPSVARDHLVANNWDLDMAIADVYPEEGKGESDYDGMEEDQSRQAGTTPAGQATSAARTQGTGSKSRGGGKKFATLGDLGSGDGGGRPSHRHDDDDEPQDLFAGGEKSGLAVQNPDDIKRRIIEKAKKTMPPSERNSTPAKSHFTGTARTLGGDDTPSRIIEDPNAGQPQPLERVQRTLHFWKDGFSVDDGDLYRSTDPGNAQILEGIRQGRAPLSIMNVQVGQDVDVQVKQHDSNYERPKGKFKAFAGSGQRLGSPTPGVVSAPHAPVPAAAPAQAQASTGPEQPNIDESQPTVTLQIRLGDGTRLTSRFNTTHTIGDVYQFVAAASPVSQQREWVLMTTFPSVELKDRSAILGELKEYKRGGVVVQKWT
ncbi:protein phosphatase regulator [Microsporum canis]|uniref:NSFL1 cofactor p47 n=1 Tax=Arthroderma otae (strain ATCC MYA-4605 / CBS 113480) TaxID=554155 RepID=C5FI26_ARTOC|nr:NSFL1 cofactor p47 [Microsporum canis CBS 113480]EEQ29006.1 NSFL1 cofactor p47 [Microsporum canis CBS 113480]